MAIIKSNELDRYLGAGLLLWRCFTSLAFIYDFFPARWIGMIVDACNKYYQPVIRFVIAIGFLKKQHQLEKDD